MEWMDAAADMGLLWGRADRFIISRLGNISRESYPTSFTGNFLMHIFYY